jgi:hypothetical protein
MGGDWRLIIMKAISTKYIGPTNHRNSRVKAFDNANNAVTLDWAHELNSMENHTRAAKALRDKMGWKGKMVGGGTKDHYVFCFVDTYHELVIGE